MVLARVHEITNHKTVVSQQKGAIGFLRVLPLHYTRTEKLAQHFSMCNDFQALPWQQEGYTLSVTHNLHLSAF